LPSARYEKIIEAFGGSGYFVKTPEELNIALKNAFEKTNEASLINVMIDPFSQRKQQVRKILVTATLFSELNWHKRNWYMQGRNWRVGEGG
jgi:thiamine pyrophosphate-dependent acetolactate synthase large subunit-like protein